MKRSSTSKMFKTFLSLQSILLGTVITPAICVVFLVSVGSAADITLAWDANTESDIAGYFIYYRTEFMGPPDGGTGAQEGDSPICVPFEVLNNPDYPTYTIHGLSDVENYFFLVTAYNTSGYQSGFSNEVYQLCPNPFNMTDAAFEAAPVSGSVELTVSFFDQSTGQNDTWSWDFGDGGKSADPDPFHVYDEVGSYDVRLIVRGPYRCDDIIKNDFIIVNPSESETNCSNGSDDDYDGLVDCDDSDCDGDLACICDNNGICETGEDCNNCLNDCFSGASGYCGDGICAGGGEDCFTCPQDCRCAGNICKKGCCGDLECSGEDPNQCPVDCDPDFVPPPGSCCGDGFCEGEEDATNCAIDCADCTVNADCNDGNACTTDKCSSGWCSNTLINCDDGNSCTADGCDSRSGSCLNGTIIPCCGDTICDPSEDQCSCPADCGTPPSIESNCSNGIDENCDGQTDCNDGDCAGNPACPSGIDDDGDNYTENQGDCDDADPLVNPGATEVPYNGKDDDCDPATADDDLDGDSYPIATDCDDTNQFVNPNAAEICDDGIDNDCDDDVDSIDSECNDTISNCSSIQEKKACNLEKACSWDNRQKICVEN
jgi:PKD repeat protein